MVLDDLKLYNPRLYWDMVARGSIPYSQAGALAWGNPVQSVFIELFIGGPDAPDYTSIPLPTDYGTPTQFAESGNYPKPWRSYAQSLQNANYTYVGPYACFIGFVGCDGSGCVSDTCTDANRKSGIKPIRIWGRWGVAISGPNSTEGAFFPQDWYTPSEGTFNANYWNTYFEENQQPLDPEWQLRKDWWESINKVTIETYFGNTGLRCKIEVAQSFFEFGTPEYFAGIDLGAYPDLVGDGLTLLTVMVATAALVRWL